MEWHGKGCMRRKIEYWQMVDGPKGYIAPSKYQSSSFDISMLLPFKVTVSELEKSVSGAHDFINEVSLVDQFEKEEWPDSLSVTISFTPKRLIQ